MRFVKIASVTAACLGVGFSCWCESVAAQEMTTHDRQRHVLELQTAPNPLEAVHSFWIEELTYIEVRDRIRDGHTIAIIPTGGIEQNGPYLVTGKHNVILESLCPAIANELGDALCAPIVPFVPEGTIDPPSGAMQFSGSISVKDETFHALLDDIASSLKQHGFKDIVFIGDSGGNQRGMRAVAEELNVRWQGTGVSAHFIGQFYTPGWDETMTYTAEVLEVVETRNDGHHDDIWVTAIMMVSDPTSVRYQQRVKADLASINGISIVPMAQTIELGQKMVDFRARYTAVEIRAAIDTK